MKIIVLNISTPKHLQRMLQTSFMVYGQLCITNMLGKVGVAKIWRFTACVYSKPILHVSTYNKTLTR